MAYTEAEIRSVRRQHILVAALAAAGWPVFYGLAGPWWGGGYVASLAFLFLAAVTHGRRVSDALIMLLTMVGGIAIGTALYWIQPRAFIVAIAAGPMVIGLAWLRELNQTKFETVQSKRDFRSWIIGSGIGVAVGLAVTIFGIPAMMGL